MSIYSINLADYPIYMYAMYACNYCPFCLFGYFNNNDTLNNTIVNNSRICVDNNDMSGSNRGFETWGVNT